MRKNKLDIGSLVKMKISMRFSREFVVKCGDYAIVLQNSVSMDMVYDFDYLISVCGIEIYVFEEEVELVII